MPTTKKNHGHEHDASKKMGGNKMKKPSDPKTRTDNNKGGERSNGGRDTNNR
jgi:hypothetical protein